MKSRMAICAACMCVAAFLWAQGTVSLLPPNAGGGAGDDVVEVMGRGVGATKVEALKEAYRDAIERAVGLYVDAEQMVKNDELVASQILTQSNAYIKEYRVVKETADASGCVTLNILATVKKSALTKKLSDVMPPQSFKLGNDAQNLHAQIVTKEKRGEDAVALLEKTLAGVNPITQLIRLTLADTKMLAKEVGNGMGSPKKTCYFYRFKFEVDETKYYENYLPPLLKVLDQISLETRTVWLQSADTTLRGNQLIQSRMELARNYISSGEAISTSQLGFPRGEGSLLRLDGLSGDAHFERTEGYYDGVVALGDTKNVWYLTYGSQSPEHGQNIRFELPQRGGGRSGNDEWNEIVRRNSSDSRSSLNRMLKSDVFQVMVITEMGKNRMSAKAKCYELPRGCAEAILRWQWGLCGGYDNSRNPLGGSKGLGRTTYNIILRDSANEIVCVRTMAFSNIALINSAAGQGVMFDGGDLSGGYGWYVTPMIHTNAQSMQRWIGFDIPRDDLPRIASISIELAE